MKYFIKTFGCQMNEADSERIARAFNNKRYTKTEDIGKANIIIINTCIVRQSAENRAYGLINKLSPKNKQSLISGKNKTSLFSDENKTPSSPKAKIILAGCLAGWALNDKSGKNLRVLRKRLGPNIQIVPTEKLANFQIKPFHSDKDHAWVPISNGCNNFCSYCIVPYARGREISRPFNEIIDEIKSLLENGYSKITILGQNVNSYGKDLTDKKITFPHLLKTAARIPGLKLIDFISSNPWDFSDDLIKTIAKHPNITRTIHLPIQSGDDEILKKMSRPYTAKLYLELIEKIKKAIPKVKFTTDIIVGFPGETKKQFQNTVNLCKKIGFSRAFINRYSPRPGTAAASLPDNVPPQEKKRRWWILEKLINEEKTNR